MSTVLVSALLSATALVSAAWSQAAQNSGDAVMRHLAQYMVRTGQEQFDQGSYDQALKTFQDAQEYKDYLDPVEQRKLQSLQQKAAAAAEQRQATQAKSAPETPRPNGGLSDGTVTAPTPSLNSVAHEYYESVKAYFAGDFGAAKEGFTKVLQNEALPPAMAEAIRGYLVEMDAKQGGGQPLTPVSAPAVGVTALANTPGTIPATDTNAPAALAAPSPVSEVERIAELYTRSLELYNQGELLAARQGFAEVAKSGLFQAAAGRRPEDYIIAIDRRLAVTQAAQPPVTAVPPTPVPQAPAVVPAPAPQATTVASGPIVPEQGSSIEAINRRRSVICSYTDATVSDAVARGHKLIAQNQFDASLQCIADAQRRVDEVQFYLGEELYKQHTQRLVQMTQRIEESRTAHAQELAEQRRREAAAAQQELRTQAEADRANRINELLERAKAYWKQQQYEASLGQLEALLAIDPLHDEALTLKHMVEDMVYLRKQLEIERLSGRQRTEMFLDVDEAQVPYADAITYPKNWKEIIQRPTRKPDDPFQLDPANVLVHEQLNREVDLSQLTYTTAMSEAIEIIRRSVEPPLNIVVLWRDLLTNVGIEPTSPINMDGLPKVRLGTALDNLVKAISDPTFPDYPVEYVIDKGVVTIGTLDSLPQKKMETRVYDISDLVGYPANYSQMGQMMGMMGGGMMGGMMGGMGMGGMGGGMMGGMGGGMMGGMGGGTMGGMGGGMMGGMGGMGGGMMGGMGGMGMGGMGGGMMGGMGGMGMGGMGGGMMGGMGGMSGMGGMGGMSGMGGMGGYGGGSMSSQGMAYGLRQLIQESVNPLSWLDISTDPAAQGQITLFPMETPKKMAVYNTPEAHQQIEQLLDELRKSLTHEVSIEARFLVVSENFLEAIGLDLDFTYRPGGKWGVITVNQDSILTAAPDASTRVPGSMGGLADTPAIGIGTGWGTALDDLQVSLLINATQGRSDSKALSAPKVTVLSGEGASFTIYDTVAYALPPTTQTQSAVGGIGSGVVGQTNLNNISAIQVGSQLSITPTITKDRKYVLLNIVSQQIDLLRMRTLQVTQTNPNTTAGAPATVTTPVTVPETETSNVATRVSVPDRGTLLLGGHKLAAQVDKEVGVPILSKIPVFGRLFTNRSSIRDEKILLILVKPTIILQEETEQEAIASLEEVALGSRP